MQNKPVDPDAGDEFMSELSWPLRDETKHQVPEGYDDCGDVSPLLIASCR